MIQAVIPGRETMNLEVLVLDYNGTLAFDGQMFKSVRESISSLSPFLEIHVLTSDTFGTVVQQCEGLSVQVKVLEGIEHVKEKADYVSQFGTREVVAIGNGANDQLMLKHARLGIAVIGYEGASAQALLSADLIVNNIDDALGLFLETKRLKATLRL